jgi:hypothetical protein
MDVANVDLNIIDVLSTQARARTYVLICGELHPLHPAGIGLPWGAELGVVATVATDEASPACRPPEK